MFFRPRQAFVVGLAICAAASVALAIVIARVWAPLFGPHVGELAASIPFAGLALGAVAFALRPSLCTREALLSRGSTLAALAAAGVLASLLAALHQRVPEVFDRAAIVTGLIVLLPTLIPFAFIGVMVGAALHHAREQVARVVFSLAAGGALGVVMAIGVLRVGAPRAALLVMIAYALGALAFYLAARGAEPAVRRARGPQVATAILASIVLFAGDFGSPWLRFPQIRFRPIEKVDAQEQTILGLATVDKAASGTSLLYEDGVRGAPIYEAKTALPVGCDELAYVLPRDAGPVAIVDSTGGRELRTALKLGQKEIYAIEGDPIVVRSYLLDRFKKAGGDVYETPGVKVVLEDARAYLRRARRDLRTIAIPALDSASADAVGAMAAEPVELFTVEGFVDVLRSLHPEGTLTVSRREAEAERLVALVAAALRRTGVTDPSQHIFGCNTSRTTTLVVRRTAFAAGETSQLRTFSRKNKLTEVFAPDAPNATLRHTLTADPIPELPTTRKPVPAPTDLRAPTDDRPFFAFLTPPSSVLATLRDPQLRDRAQALVILAVQVAIAALVLFVGFAFPAFRRARDGGPRARSVLALGALGGSLTLAASALVPSLRVLLGHPIYTFTTVAPALFGSLAIGALVTSAADAARVDAMGRRVELLAGVLALVTAALHFMIVRVLPAGFGGRVFVALVLTVPVAVIAGWALTSTLRRVASVSSTSLPASWAALAASACFAAACAKPMAIMLGYSTEILAAGLLAFVAAVALPRPRG